MARAAQLLRYQLPSLAMLKINTDLTSPQLYHQNSTTSSLACTRTLAFRSPSISIIINIQQQAAVQWTIKVSVRIDLNFRTLNVQSVFTYYYIIHLPTCPKNYSTVPSHVAHVPVLSVAHTNITMPNFCSSRRTSGGDADQQLWALSIANGTNLLKYPVRVPGGQGHHITVC